MKISVIIPVFREAEAVKPALAHLFGLPFKWGPEVVVIDGCPEGSTTSAIADERVMKIRSPKGRARQMNAGAAVATGDVLLFLHADTMLPENAPALIEKGMREPGMAAGAFDLGIDSGRPVFRLIEKLASLRSRLTRIPYGDQAIFIKTGVFEELGGYADLPLMEDVDIMRRVRRKGMKITILPEKVRTSARRWEKEGVFYCTLRNWTLVALYFLGVPPGKMVKFYK